jgi:predicted GH43/DUF377 family glycosyl hydrolase
MNISPQSSKKFLGNALIHLNEKPVLFFKTKDSFELGLAKSDDGLEFEKGEETVTITGLNGKLIDARDINISRISPLFKEYLMFFKLDKNEKVYLARSSDQLHWTQTEIKSDELTLGLTVENYIYKDKHVFYFADKTIKVGLTDNGGYWEFMDSGYADGENLVIDFTLKTSQGIFVLYHGITHKNGKKHLEVKSLLFDKNDPTKIIWHTKNSLWQEPDIWNGKESECIGCINFEGKILSYWSIEGLGIFLVTYPFFGETPSHEHKHYELKKHPENPILKPVPHHSWENEAVFNAAAFQADDKVYLIYRAVGYGYISVLGYAESGDGIRFTGRLKEPIYTGNHDFDRKKPEATFETAKSYISGGGYGGCEDPRITKIDDKLYMIYVAFNGMDPPRLALTSIYFDDFINQRFLWEKPVLISPPGIVDKSGCILPEKINGKYVIFHRIYPNILIDFLDDLNFDGSKWLKGEFKIEPRPTMWDSRKVGTGAPPIKTKDGWLMIYQGVTDKDDSKYKIGAMLLDINDPTKVLYRSNHPIIEPKEYYENNLAKFGVVYPCGAVVKDGKLLVYYGGSDSVTCVAGANLNEFLEELKSGSNVRLSNVNFND